VAVVNDDNSRHHMATDSKAASINRHTGAKAKTSSASPPTSTQTGSGETEGLPAFAKAKWTSCFLPTLYACLASATDPWQLYGEDSTFIITLQGILDIVYPKSGYNIEVGDKIYSMVRTLRDLTSLLYKTNALTV
jgi:hypothetical protein